MRVLTGVALLPVLLAARPSFSDDCVPTSQPSRYVITVDSQDDEWAATGITAEVGDLIFVVASGTVTLSKGAKVAKPGQKTTGINGGNYDSGALELKIGKTFRTYTDAKYAAETTVQGELKFRIKDTEYSDNAGSYTVQLVVVPASSIRTPTAVVAPSTQTTGQTPTGRISVTDKQTFKESTLTPDIILSKIQSAYMAGLKRCYKTHLANDRSAKGKVTLSLSVNETGRTTSSNASGFAEAVDSCIEGLMGSWRFPIPKDKDGEPTQASFAISLTLVPD